MCGFLTLTQPNRLRTAQSTSTSWVLSSSKTCAADVYLSKMFSDNYGYIVVDRDTKYAAFVDPGQIGLGDAESFLYAKKEFILKQIWATHKVQLLTCIISSKH